MLLLGVSVFAGSPEVVVAGLLAGVDVVVVVVVAGGFDASIVERGAYNFLQNTFQEFTVFS